MFLNTMTGEEKDSLLNRDNLTQTIQIQLSETEKSFSAFFFFFGIFKIYIKFKHLPTRDDPHR